MDIRLKSGGRANKTHKKEINPHSDSYQYADSRCVLGNGNICLNCPYPKCVLDREIPRVRNVITNMI